MLLIFAAIFPVALLCYFVYKKDINKEPKGLLAKLFCFGMLTCFPAAFAEAALSDIVPVEDPSIGFIHMLINVFIGVALMEEGFKWIVTKSCGYNSKEFDEIYDIILYAVFVSLGFACLENVLYVLQYGMSNAIMRAVTSIPGHASFGVIMGYFLSKAKINQLNGNTNNVNKNLVLSIIMPTLLHAIYDAILMAGLSTIIFLVFDIAMVAYCFVLVDKMSRVQYNLSYNTQAIYNNQYYQNTNYNVNTMNNNPNMYNVPNNTYTMNNNPNAFNTQNTINNNPNMFNTSNNNPNTFNVPNNTYTMNNNPNTFNTQTTNTNFCPMCGSKNNNFGYCPYCGYKIK